MKTAWLWLAVAAAAVVLAASAQVHDGEAVHPEAGRQGQQHHQGQAQEGPRRAPHPLGRRADEAGVPRWTAPSRWRSAASSTAAAASWPA